MLIFFNVQDEDDEMLKEFILRKSKSNLDLSSNQKEPLKLLLSYIILKVSKKIMIKNFYLFIRNFL